MRRDAEDLIRRYCAMARPEMLKWMTSNSCIGAARVTIAAMDVFGLEARPRSVAWGFSVPARKYVRIAGFSDQERERMREQARSYIDLEVENGWNGHVIVAVENRWLLDPSIDQATSEQFGVAVPPEILVIDTAAKGADLRQNFHLEVKGALDNGDAVAIRYWTRDDDSYLQSEAWKDIGTDILGVELALRVLKARKVE